MRSSMTPLEYTLQLHGQRRVLKKGHKHTHRHSSGIGIGTRIGISKPAHHLCSHFSAKQMSHSEEHGLGALASSDEVQARLLWMVTEGAFRWLYMAEELLFRRHRKSFSAWTCHAGYQMVVDALRDIHNCLKGCNPPWSNERSLVAVI